MNLSKKHNTIYLCLFIFFLSFSISAQDDLIIYTENSPKGQFMDKGVLTGHAVEMVQAMQKVLGTSYYLKMESWSRGYNELLNRPNIMLFATTRTKEREKLFKWVGPLHITEWAFWGKKDKTFNIKSLEDVKKLGSIGTYKDDVREQTLKKMNFKNLVSTLNNDINIRRMLEGHLDLVVFSKGGILETMKKLKIPSDKVKKVFTFKKAALYMAFSKQMDEKIIKKWENALIKIHENGEAAKIFKKWDLGEVPAVVPWVSK